MILKNIHNNTSKNKIKNKHQTLKEKNWDNYFLIY